MRVLQLIDSLRLGGAEKMAITYANALVEETVGSYLCCTRLEGLLKEDLDKRVNYLFLNKKSIFDKNAFLKLRSFIKKNNIDIVHAHGTSYFLAGLLRLCGIKFKLIWHIHNGASEKLSFFKFRILYLISYFFDGIIVVNASLYQWASTKLKCKNVIELSNFVQNKTLKLEDDLYLSGDKNAFKIICVANLRPEKDYVNLLKGFENFAENKNTTLHIIGNKINTNYAEIVHQEINNSRAMEKIFYYGSQKNVDAFLKQADLGVISSRSEGLPVALLEYGSKGLCVVSTDVGKCKEVINKNGIIVKKEDFIELAQAFCKYFNDRESAISDAQSFQQEIFDNYSQKAVISKALLYYKNL